MKDPERWESVGHGLQQIGCALFMVPFAIIGLFVLAALIGC